MDDDFLDLPLFQDNGVWWFYGFDWTDLNGPYETIEEATKELNVFLKEFENLRLRMEELEVKSCIK